MQRNGNQPFLSVSRGRIDPASAAWTASRKPLVGEFTWKDRTFFAVANHSTSKGGDESRFGRFREPVPSSEVQRHQQAQEVRNSQVLDQILVSKSWKAVQYDIVHTNSEFHDQDSDHDPQVVRLRIG